MLLLPYKTRLAWQEAPVITWALACLMVLVFALQAQDNQRTDKALQLYAQSSLARVEADRYRVWLQQRQDKASFQRLMDIDEAFGSADYPIVSARAIQSDPAFLRELRSAQIIKRDEPMYAQWREDRIRFEAEYKRAFEQRLQIRDDTGQPWRLLTYTLVHTSFVSLLLSLLMLLIVGPFAEHTLGRGRYVLAYALAAAVAGGIHLLAQRTALSGAATPIVALSAIAAMHYRQRRVPTQLWIGRRRYTMSVPVVAAVPLAVLMAAWQSDGPASSWTSILAALIGGFALGSLFKVRDGALPDDKRFASAKEEFEAQRRQDLAHQARDALMRMDTRRAVRLYQQLVEDHPRNTNYLSSYFNAALMAQDHELLSDAATRILWLRTKRPNEELRRVFLQMSQPSALRMLPVDEQLRLTRRLVRMREDNAALKVLDSILDSPQLRHLYGRQIADCLLGLFTTYTRHGLRAQAQSVHKRLQRYFPQPATISGLAPNTTRSPSTLRSPTSHSTSPSTLHIDLN